MASSNSETVMAVGGQVKPRIALYSRRLAESRVWHVGQYEFEDVIAEIDDVQLFAPGLRRSGQISQFAHGVKNRARRAAGLPRTSLQKPVDGAPETDLFFAIFAAPSEISALSALNPVLERARKKVAFIVEMYWPEVSAARDYLRQLRGFDHIFVFTRAVIPAIAEITGVPTSYLANGIDAVRFVPTQPSPERTTAVTSYGRRISTTHNALVEATKRGDFYYHFDTVRGPFDVSGHGEHRLALAQSLHRSRYSIIHRNNDDELRSIRTGGEETLSNRLFEAAAAGTVILGSPPRSPDFDELFPWRDAVITIPTPFSSVVDLVQELELQPERVAAASRAGQLAGLRSFDWAYRWHQVLETVGMFPLPALEARVASLRARADELN